MTNTLAEYAASAIRRFNFVSIANIVTLAGLIFLYPLIYCYGVWYLLAVIIATDVLRFFARGAWYRAPLHATSHHHNPCKDINAYLYCIIRVFSFSTLVALSIFYRNNAWAKQTIATIWYALTFFSVIETFRCILHTMHKHNPDWLSGAKGHIGLPNWISIIRLPLSIITPHIYIANTYGEYSNAIATSIIIAAICTDALDGLIARATKSITKAGKYLDPLGDKLIFFPNAVALMLLVDRDWMLILTIICFAIATIRDILFIIWFFLKGRKIPKGIGASMVDKVRMGGICVWLLSTAIAVSTSASASIFFTILSAIAIGGVALLSIASVFIDYARVKRQLS